MERWGLGSWMLDLEVFARLMKDPRSRPFLRRGWVVRDQFFVVTNDSVLGMKYIFACEVERYAGVVCGWSCKVANDELVKYLVL